MNTIEARIAHFAILYRSLLQGSAEFHFAQLCNFAALCVETAIDMIIDVSFESGLQMAYQKVIQRETVT